MSDSETMFLKADMLLDECIALRESGSNSDQGKADMIMAEVLEIRERMQKTTYEN